MTRCAVEISLLSYFREMVCKNFYAGILLTDKYNDETVDLYRVVEKFLFNSQISRLTINAHCTTKVDRTVSKTIYIYRLRLIL